MKIQIQEDKYIQRDINWLRFNHRVLQEAKDLRNPLFERIKFLAIFSSNLDEYFKVRVASLRQIKKIDKDTRKKLQLRPNKTLKTILQNVLEQQEEFGTILNDQILPELNENGVHLINSEQYNDVQKEFVTNYFKKHCNRLEIFDTSTLSPHLEDGSLYFSVYTEDENIYIVKIPSENRFIEIPTDQKNTYQYTLIDDIVQFELKHIFKSKEVKEIGEIKLSRDAELYLEEDYEGELAEQIYKALSQRNIGQPTRLLYDNKISKEHQKLLRKTLKVGKVDMMPGGTYHNFSDFMSFPNPTGNADLEFEPKPQLDHPVLSKATNYFETIGAKDQLVHFPYQKFDYVSNFLAQAAEDKNVTAIKISLYRMAKESALNSALLKAIENGKDVTIFVEAQARFDEENNIKWGKKFSDKGAKVIYSIPNIKVHSKIFLIQRLEDNQTKNYCYIGTGNFNAKTATVYADHGLFTANPKISDELCKVFEVLERDLIIPRTKHLLVSPFNTRKEFDTLINNEIENARAGKRAKITAKMNSLHDRKMIYKLYEASREGVEIRLLIRGFSCLVPGVEGLSDHITMTSIVDRYLEHGRIYLFENDGDEIMYTGSADWMRRNLDYRIEVLTPILDDDVKNELKTIFKFQLNDNQKARVCDEDFTNKYVEQKPGEKVIRSQYAIYNYLKEKAEKAS
ncbi:polyphosphate kinase [Pustulibacterium marinum]|uniref:Polyphosphate kinase n=1 Tax=Pustulibacterium marinum TaxID=1224947 RepID=A0A1I7IHB7_9FLAO|nr:polyphosphate kinase 1 [Pustulibacterium marinum]SFU72323.1 polyphosphate kinase [Pustulibacterium marinum]